MGVVPLKIVCIGDSITNGQYLPDGDKPWPELLTGYEVVAAGKNSDTTRLGLERFPAIQAMEPQGVVIQFGHNDCNHWESDRGLPRVSPAAYRANLAEMVERCRTFGATPFLCTLTPTLRNTSWDVGYNELLLQVAFHEVVPVINVRGAFGDGTGLLLDDGLHLNAVGHQLYATVVQEALDRSFR